MFVESGRLKKLKERRNTAQVTRYEVEQMNKFIGEQGGSLNCDYYKIIAQISPHDRVFDMYSEIEDLGHLIAFRENDLIQPQEETLAFGSDLQKHIEEQKISEEAQ